MSEHLICALFVCLLLVLFGLFFLFSFSSGIKALSLNYYYKGRYRHNNAFAKILSFGLAFFSLRNNTQNKSIDTTYI